MLVEFLRRFERAATLVDSDGTLLDGVVPQPRPQTPGSSVLSAEPGICRVTFEVAKDKFESQEYSFPRVTVAMKLGLSFSIRSSWIRAMAFCHRSDNWGQSIMRYRPGSQFGRYLSR